MQLGSGGGGGGAAAVAMVMFAELFQGYYYLVFLGGRAACSIPVNPLGAKLLVAWQVTGALSGHTQVTRIPALRQS